MDVSNYSRRPEGKQAAGGLDDYSVLDAYFYSSNSLYCFGHLVGVESRNGIERAKDSDYSRTVVDFNGGVSFYGIISCQQIADGDYRDVGEFTTEIKNIRKREKT